jgi:hypothetical protein
MCILCSRNTLLVVAQIAEIKEEIEKYKGQGGQNDRQRKKLLKDLEDRLASTEARAEQYEAKALKAAKTVSQLEQGIQSIFNKIGCDKSALSDMLGTTGVTESNMMQYLVSMAVFVCLLHCVSVRIDTMQCLVSMTVCMCLLCCLSLRNVYNAVYGEYDCLYVPVGAVYLCETYIMQYMVSMTKYMNMCVCLLYFVRLRIEHNAVLGGLVSLCSHQRVRVCEMILRVPLRK